MNRNCIPSAMDDCSDGDQPTASQNAVDRDPGTKQPTDTVTGVAQPKNRSSTQGRIRTVFSEEQKWQLLQSFHENSYMSALDRAKLAKALGLTYKQVTTWYQNRRMKMKRVQYGQNPANYWNQPNFSAFSSQTFPMAPTYTPGRTQCRFLSSGQVQNPPLANPVTQVLPPHSMHQEFQNSSASLYLQVSQLATQSDPYLGNYGPEPPMIPAAPSVGFTSQIPGSSTGHSSLGILPIPTFEDELQYITLSSSYTPTGAECSYPSGAGVAGSGQDTSE